MISVDFGPGPERSISLFCHKCDGVVPLDAQLPLRMQASAFPHDSGCVDPAAG
jgi:hypothetical protein